MGPGTRSFLLRKTLVYGLGLILLMLLLSYLFPPKSLSTTPKPPPPAPVVIEGPDPLHDVHNFYPRPFLDHAYRPRSKFDIIIAMYREDSLATGAAVKLFRESSVLKGMDVNVTVYLKDKIRDPVKVKARSGADQVVMLPNVGREAATYLHHIVSNWDGLAEHTLFMQADVHEPEMAVRRLEDYFVPRTGMLSLGFGFNTCDCMKCKDPTAVNTVWNRIPQIYSMVTGELCPTDHRIDLGYQGQFVVSAKRIRGTSKRVYKHLMDILEADEGHWIHQDKHTDTFWDSPSEPYFGHQMERAWMVVFQCAEEGLAGKCGRIGDVRQEGMGDDNCQCLDN